MFWSALFLHTSIGVRIFLGTSRAVGLFGRLQFAYKDWACVLSNQLIFSLAAACVPVSAIKTCTKGARAFVCVCVFRSCVQAEKCRLFGVRSSGRFCGRQCWMPRNPFRLVMHTARRNQNAAYKLWVTFSCTGAIIDETNADLEVAFHSAIHRENMYNANIEFVPVVIKVPVADSYVVEKKGIYVYIYSYNVYDLWDVCLFCISCMQIYRIKGDHTRVIIKLRKPKVNISRYDLEVEV